MESWLLPRLRFVAGMAEVVGGHRTLRCSFCASAWELTTYACIYCAENGERFVTAAPDEERKDRRVEVCSGCGSYLKTVDVESCPPSLFSIGDLETMDLDVAAMEHGYARPAMKSSQRQLVARLTSECALLPELVVDSLRVPFGSAERADACRVALVLGWNLVPGRGLVYGLSSFHFRLSPRQQILAEVRVSCNRSTSSTACSGYHRVDVLDRRNDLRKRLRMAHSRCHRFDTSMKGSAFHANMSPACIVRRAGNSPVHHMPLPQAIMASRCWPDSCSMFLCRLFTRERPS